MKASRYRSQGDYQVDRHGFSRKCGKQAFYHPVIEEGLGTALRARHTKLRADAFCNLEGPDYRGLGTHATAQLLDRLASFDVDFGGFQAPEISPPALSRR